MNRCYSELSELRTFDERFKYLSLTGYIGESTFGFDRYLNQRFYTSTEWRRVRDDVIARDLGCDLGLFGYNIGGRIIIHHMNPIRSDDILHSSEILMNPEYLVCVCHDTHNALHFGAGVESNQIVERTKNDTCPWKVNKDE